MKTSFDYGDLEKVATFMFHLMLAEAQDAGLPRPPWNKSALVTEAVNAVAFKEES